MSARLASLAEIIDCTLDLALAAAAVAVSAVVIAVVVNHATAFIAVVSAIVFMGLI